MTQLKYLFAVSILLALAGIAIPPVVGESERTMTLSLLFAVMWMALFVFGLARYRRRGLWLLIGAPFALYWPAATAVIWVSCAHSSRVCA